MLDDPEWSQLTDREIAEACIVDRSFVTKRIKARVEPAITEAAEGDNHLDPDAEQLTLDECAADATGGEVATDTVEPFDWDAAKVRSAAMDAIRARAPLAVVEAHDGNAYLVPNQEQPPLADRAADTSGTDAEHPRFGVRLGQKLLALVPRAGGQPDPSGNTWYR